jgi:serine/threonine protein kinase
MEFSSDRDHHASNQTVLPYDADRTIRQSPTQTVRPGVRLDKSFDVLSFLEMVTQLETNDKEEWNVLSLLSLYLGPWNMFLSFTPYSGTCFSVTLVPRKHLSRQAKAGMGPDTQISKLVALKTPKLSENEKLRNAELFGMMAKEYRILKSEPLRSHENIVTVFGCCWQSLDVYAGLPIPSLILEGTELGDLADFARVHKLTLRERLRICLDITSGLREIHALDIVHGDVKLENVLIFHSTNQGYVAKIADFGSAILLGQSALPCERPVGTPLYSAPEWFDPTSKFSREDLFKMDIFCLGIVFSVLLLGMHVLKEMKRFGSKLETIKRNEGLEAWFIEQGYQSMEDLMDQSKAPGTEYDDKWETDAAWSLNSIMTDEQVLAEFQLLLKLTLATDPIKRLGDAEEVLFILRTLLFLQLKRITQQQQEHSQTDNEPHMTPETLTRISKAIGINKVRLRKLTRADVELSTKLNKQEFDLISLCYCFPELNLGSLIRATKFIRKLSEDKERRRRPPWNWRSKKRSALASRLLKRKLISRKDLELMGEIRRAIASW